MSLIIVIQEIKLHRLSDQPIPDNAFIPSGWAVFSHWQALPEDKGKKIEQLISLCVSGQKVLLEVVAEFEMEQRYHRQIVRIVGMPVVRPGTLALSISIREKGKEKWEFVSDYPIEVTHADAIVKTEQPLPQ